MPLLPPRSYLLWFAYPLLLFGFLCDVTRFKMQARLLCNLSHFCLDECQGGKQEPGQKVWTETGKGSDQMALRREKMGVNYSLSLDSSVSPQFPDSKVPVSNFTGEKVCVLTNQSSELQPSMLSGNLGVATIPVANKQ